MSEPECHEPRRLAEEMFRLALIYVLDERVDDPDTSRAILRGQSPGDYDRWCSELAAAGISDRVPGSLLSPDRWEYHFMTHLAALPQASHSPEQEPDDAYGWLPVFLANDVAMAVGEEVGR